MKEMLKVLIEQSFRSQNERIDELKKDILKVTKRVVAYKEKIANLEELNGLLDKELSEIKDYIRTYVASNEENSLMEEYKFGK
jgi:hypothetical protein